MQNPQKRIVIRRTEGEFELAIQRLKDMKRGDDIQKYLRTEVRRLVSTFKVCPDCVTSAYGEKKDKAFFIEEGGEEHLILMQIADIMQKPLNAVIDDFFIAPLLVPKMK